MLLTAFSMYAQPTTYGIGSGTGGNWTDVYYGRDAGKTSTGTSNTFLGARAGQLNTSGSSNTFTGTKSGQRNAGESNTFTGANTGRSNTGDFNSFLGAATGYYNTSGKENTFIGERAGFRNEIGNNNTFIGRRAGYNNISGTANTYIGWGAGYNATGHDNVFIGTYAGSQETGSEKLYIDNHSTSLPLIYGDFSTNQFTVNGQAYKPGGGLWVGTSDARLKHSIKSYEKGLEELLEVEPVSYKYTEAIQKSEDQKEYVGVIAQDIQKVVPSMVSEFELTNAKTNKKGNYLAVDPSEFTYMLINAVKEQQTALEQKDAEVDELKERLSQLESLVQNALNTSGSIQRIELDTPSELFQNQPNPFNETTRIKYALSPDTKNAVMQITDISGKLLKTIQLDASMNGEVIIEAQELNAGTYIYSLIADGQLLSTKKMLLTK